jgi:hypothetical protein
MNIDEARFLKAIRGILSKDPGEKPAKKAKIR